MGRSKNTPKRIKAIHKCPNQYKKNQAVVSRFVKSINSYRKKVGIERSVTAKGVTGGTVVSAEPTITGFSKKIYIGASPYGKPDGEAHNVRYQSPQKFEATKNHAEQNALGDIADELDKTFKNKKDAVGTIEMYVEQKVCTVCRQGFSNNGKPAGVLKQFSDEYPNVTLVIRNAENDELLAISNGQIIRYKYA